MIQEQQRPVVGSQQRGGGGGGVRSKPGQVRTGRGGSVGSRTASDDLMSRSMADRKALLGETYYDSAKKLISKALTLDEKGERMQALELYNKSLSTLRSGLAAMMSSVGLGTRDDSINLHEMRSKMEKMKEQIKSRMEVLLQLEIEDRAMSRSVTASTTSRTGLTSSVSGQTRSVTSSTIGERGRVREEAKADLVFNVDTDIGLFEVDGREHVRKYEDVDAVSVFRYREEIKGQPPAFLECGGFVYPLIPGKSPILKASERVYMFPELRNDDGTSVGISLDGASPEDLAKLDQLLSQLADLKTVDVSATVEKKKEAEKKKEEVVGGVTEDKEQPTWGTTIAGGIDKGVSWVSTKISQGTVVAGSLITMGANKIREKIEPNETPTEIPEGVQKGVHYTRKATGCVVGVSEFLMMSLAKLTVKVGKGVAGTIKESDAVKSMDINPHAVEAWRATKSGIKGAATVFTDLERAAVAMIKSTGKETSKTVGHKYGEDAGKVTNDSLAAAAHVTNLTYTYWSWKTWGIRFLGKVGEVIAKDDTKKDSTSS